ncbi:DeoR/GlpR family DNA-binding transcription regulator [Exiguobacterium sp. TNDT2]|uniref:DeoR/GlpR family DNA-binding transcription regulator n=1 Tax=Exiguobacterium sp. TNDT2 TaxID=2233531 RepID=UPI000DEFC508|nr:DeoR/GlpR family DNA-binding transcription regulator [Exiguobacterium sp. TNDT2]
MLKEQRLEAILNLINTHGMVRVSEITELLNVTEMTVRRDLQLLEDQGQVERIHGGAKAVNGFSDKELSHIEKQGINIEEKQQIARTIASLVEENDTIFLGPGTTIEYVYDFLTVFPARIVTNSIHVFNRFNKNEGYDLILIGGSYRARTGAFVGSFANNTLKKINVKKAFIGSNGVHGNEVYTSNEEEGITQSIILDNAHEKYIVADHSKIWGQDFFSFYHLDGVTALITDDQIPEEKKLKLEEFVKVIY